MEIRLEWLRAFRAIMQTGTVTGATALVLRTQPQVSRMISGLEMSLGFHLFAREGRRLIPTEDGLRFYSQIEPLLTSFDRLSGVAEDIKEKRGKPLVIAAEPFMLESLVPHAVETMHRIEGTKFAVDLCVRETGLWLSQSNAEVAVVALPFTQSDLEQVSFAEAELVATLPAGHPLEQAAVVDIAELAAQPFVALRTTTLMRSQIDRAAVQSGRSLKPVIEAASGSTACEFVARGIGVSISDPVLARAYRARGVVTRRLSVPLRLTYGLMLNRSAASPQIAQMVGCIVESARELGGDLVAIAPNLREQLEPILGVELATRALAQR